MRAVSPKLSQVPSKKCLSPQFHSKVRDQSPYFRDIPTSPKLKPVRRIKFKPDTADLFSLMTVPTKQYIREHSKKIYGNSAQ